MPIIVGVILANLNAAGCVFFGETLIQAPCWLVNFLIGAFVTAVVLDVLVYWLYPKIRRKVKDRFSKNYSFNYAGFDEPVKRPKQDAKTNPKRQELANEIWLEVLEFEKAFKPMAHNKNDERAAQFREAKRLFGNIQNNHLAQSKWVFGNTGEIPKSILELGYLLEHYGDELSMYGYYQEEHTILIKARMSVEEIENKIEKSFNLLWGTEGLAGKIYSTIGQLKSALYKERE
jgi:hypothetical protein